jgi:hypothetical protein
LQSFDGEKKGKPWAGGGELNDGRRDEANRNTSIITEYKINNKYIVSPLVKNLKIVPKAR